MDAVTLGAIAFFVAFIILSIFMVHKHVKLFFFISLGLTLIFVGFFAWIFFDVLDIQRNFQNSTKIVMLEQEGEFLTGLVISDDPIFFNQEELEAYSRAYQAGNYDFIRGDHYKAMIFSAEIVNYLPERDYIIGDIRVSNSIAKQALFSDNPADALGINPLYIQEDMNQIKGFIFGTMLIESIMDMEDPLFFFEQYKKGRIFVYPETAVFKTLKILPLSLIKSAVNRALPRLTNHKIIKQQNIE